MRLSLITIALLLLALGAVEALAYWWMHPAPAGLGDPVLAYRPGENAEKRKTETLKEDALAPADSSSSILSASEHASVSGSPTYTPLPEIYSRSAPMLRCSGGQVFHLQLDSNIGLHLAYFEWNNTDTGSVLEAFRHMPEACMGSIGMTLIEKLPPRHYVVGRQGTGDGGRESGDGGRESGGREQRSEVRGQGSEVRDQRSEIRGKGSADAPARSSSSSSSPPNLQSPIPKPHLLVFDHTVFREGGEGGARLRPPVHSFRAVWISGIEGADARSGFGGDTFKRLRTIRLKAVTNRLRPPHARVVQGTVRGAPNPDAAWQAFEQAILHDLVLK
jgi:hypothetical protein